MINQSPKITVVIPTYNQADFLAKALKSLIQQTYDNWEAIIVNNYSTDDTLKVAFSFQDPRIKIMNIANDGIIAKSRNAAINCAKGEYISFLDSDDLWYPTKLQKSIKAILSENAELVCHDQHIALHDKITGRLHCGPKSAASYHNLLFNNNVIMTSGVTVKKSVLVEVGNFSEERKYITVEDYDLWLKLAKRDTRFVFLPDILGQYTLHEQNNSKTEFHLIATKQVVDDHYEALTDKAHYSSQYRNKLSLISYARGRFFITKNKKSAALREFILSLKYNPLNWRTYVFIFRLLIFSK